ncbi:hypothetical protein ACLB2K_044026 [Fragaria x ananassa]
MAVPADLKKLDEYLLSRSYITGYQASKDDITVLAALAEAPSAQYVNVLRWYKHIEALLRISGVSGEGCGVTVKGDAPIIAAGMDVCFNLACHYIVPET